MYCFLRPILLLLLRSAAATKVATPDCKDGQCKAQYKPQAQLHKKYMTLIKEYSFQPVVNERRQYVNIILVRAPFRSQKNIDQYEKYKDKILFLGICSFEDFPLKSPNPYSPYRGVADDFYLGLFPGFLHMFRDPSFFPSHVKRARISQSDFALPDDLPRYKKKYDFVFSGSDQDVANDCNGWSSWAKNWSFVKQSLEVMCGEYNLTGVLVATKAKVNRSGLQKCSLPEVCNGKIKQTRFLDQGDFFKYVKASRFAYFPQVHDASPRASTQVMTLNVPVLMNWHIVGGWKYVNNYTGEFFHDMSDFRQSLDTILHKVKEGKYYPREWVTKNYGDINSGRRFKRFIDQKFADRVALPPETELLIPTGA